MFYELIIVIFSTLISVFFLLYPSAYEGNSVDTKNSFCQAVSAYEADQQQKEFQDQVVSQKYSLLNKMSCRYNKKQKIVWLMLDGMAHDQAQILIDKTKDNSVSYKVRGPEFRQSGAIHDTYITGKFSLNMLGTPQLQDNILDQIQKSTQGLKYFGTPYPVFNLVKDRFLVKFCPSSGYNEFIKAHADQTVVDKYKNKEHWSKEEAQKDIDKYYSYFSKITNKDWDQCFKQVVYRKISPDFLHFENWMFGYEDSYHYSPELFKSNCSSGINNCEDNSALYYTSRTDYFNHGWGRNSPTAYFHFYRSARLLESLAKYIEELKKNYVLVISSDHGGQLYDGDDNYSNHGFQTDANQGFLYIAMDGIQGKGHTGQMTDRDIASTVASLIENSNIPIQSEGKPQEVFTDTVSQFLRQFQHYHQLKLQLKSSKKYNKKNIQTIVNAFKLNQIESELQQLNDKIINNMKQQNLDSTMENLKKYFNKYEQKQQGGDAQQEKQQIEKLTTLIQQKNKEISDYNSSLNKERKKTYLLALLFGAILFFFCHIAMKRRDKIFILKSRLFALAEKNKLKQILVWSSLVLFFADNLSMVFIFWTGNDFNLSLCIVYIIFKFVLIVVLCLDIFSKSNKISQYLNNSPQNKEGAYKLENQTSFSKLSNYNTVENEDKQDEVLSDRNISLDQEKQLKNQRLYSEDSDSWVNSTLLIKVLSSTLVINIACIVLNQVEFLPFLKRKIPYEKTWPFYTNIAMYIIFHFFIVEKKNSIFHKQTKINYDTNESSLNRSIKLKEKLDLWIIRLLVVGMIVYDTIPFELAKTKQQFKYNSIIVISIFFFMAFNPYKTRKDTLQGGERVNITNPYTTILLCYLLLLFYFADIVDKFAILFFIIPTYSLLTSLYESDKSSLVLKVFSLVCIFREAGMLYLLFKGTYDLDINLAAGNKTLGGTQDSTPILTALIFGLNKGQCFLLSILYAFHCCYKVSSSNNNLSSIEDEKQAISTSFESLFLVKLVLNEVSVFGVLLIGKGEGYEFLWALMHSMFYAAYFIYFQLSMLPIKYIKRCFSYIIPWRFFHKYSDWSQQVFFLLFTFITIQLLWKYNHFEFLEKKEEE